MSTVYEPLVSCVMPTADRRVLVPRAIQYFLRQSYQNKELVILDDGQDSIADLIPNHPQVRYIRLTGQRTLGAKRNECVEASRGDLIMHWDDDDWMASHRISYQVEALLRQNAEVCGLQRMLFFDLSTGEGWLYQYPDTQRPWLAGGSLLYTRDFWRRSPFPAIQVASDTRFVWDRTMDKRVVLPDCQFYVAMIHSGNTSPKTVDSSYWSKWTNCLSSVMGEDFAFYNSLLNSDRKPTPAIAMERASSSLPAESTNPIPTFSILMVVHNALEMTCLSTLKTLRHIAGQDARLVVVDNGSTDGTERWLRLLAQRGDIDLIRNETNLGHGPALEIARRKTSSPYVVALDSDAFPLQDNWLTHLQGLLNEQVKVAGIRHHRDYIHPSCLMIARETMDQLNVTFLNEKEQPSQFDVAERVSQEIKEHGYSIAGLERTKSQRRGSASEPVYLGSEYEGLVYHQWYTTRAETSNGAPVDDVPPKALENSLQELFSQHGAEAREVTVVMGIRAAPDEPQRLTNAEVCLQALNLQTLPRWQYRIVLVEQDIVPRAQSTLRPLVDRYIFAYNAGPYNRGWAFNIGAGSPGCDQGALLLIDADLLVSSDFLQRGLDRLREGKRAVLPYTEVVYLNPTSTQQAIRDFAASPLRPLNAENYTGRLFDTSQGGCIWVDASLYREVGGHDERFRGWGREDREFWDRLSRLTHIEQLPGRQLHLDHPRPAEEDSSALANQLLYDQIAAAPDQRIVAKIGDMQLYSSERYDELKPIEHSRPWENWHRWQPSRIRKIVDDEQRKLSSNRKLLAEMLVGLGDSLLDLGCGPGALWRHFDRYRKRFSWAGVDVTQSMLREARSLFSDVPILRADSGTLPFAEKSFDVVVLRHVLEHLPEWLMGQTLAEALRVAREAVVLAFYIPPVSGLDSFTQVVGDNFLETKWAVKAVEEPISNSGWAVAAKLNLKSNASESDEVWILNPASHWSKSLDPPESLKVSIIMPTYRRAHTVFKTIQSIRAQTHCNWELVIIDNEGSTNYRFDDPRIFVYNHPEYLSASYARNQGLKYVSGDLVCFFDDDDYMFPTYLERFVETFVANPKVNMVCCGMIVSNGGTNFSFATPECCLRREYATPHWTSSSNPAHDQLYFSSIVRARRWSESSGEIITVREPLCRANSNQNGGLRSGRL